MVSKMCQRWRADLRELTGGAPIFPVVAWMLALVMSGVLMYGVSSLRTAATLENIILTSCFSIAELFLLGIALELTYISMTQPRNEPQTTITAIAPRLPTGVPSPSTSRPSLPSVPEEGTFEQANPIAASPTGRSK